MKYIFVLLFTFAVTVYAYADDVTENNILPTVSPQINVSSPEQSGSWSFGLEAHGLNPSNSNFNYSNSANANGSNNFQMQQVNPQTSIGYGADSTYHFSDSGSDMSLSWQGMH